MESDPPPLFPVTAISIPTHTLAMSSSGRHSTVGTSAQCRRRPLAEVGVWAGVESEDG